MLIENSRPGEFSGMSVPADLTSGILPPLSAKSAKELHSFIARSLVETGMLVASLSTILWLLY